MKTITYVNQKSLAKMLGVFGIFSGFVMGIFVGIFAGVGSSITGFAIPGFGFTGLIVFSIISYGIVGYLSGYFGAAVYNKLIVPKLGGIEIELE